MSYHLDNHVINLSGPSGNAFRVIGICKDFVRQIEGSDAAIDFGREAFGTTGEGEFRHALGADWRYEDVLRFCKNKTGVTFWSPTDLGLPEELCLVQDTPPEGYIYT